jgi:hypothetical protein
MFYLRSAQIPSFLSPTLVDRILNIGRAITFIKLCLEKLPKQTNTIGGGSSKKKRDSAVKKSYRMINKNKQLTLYGVVVDKETNEEEEEETEDFSNESDEEEEEEEEEEGKQKTKKNNKNKSSTPTNSLALTKKDKSSNKENKVNKKNKKKKRAIKDTQEDLVLFLQDMNSHFRISLLLEKLRQTGGELNFSKMIYSLSNQLDDKLVRLMRQKFFLKEHLLALKKFMLLGQGDFITCLMDNLGPELKKKAGQLFRHNLLSILETAIRSSNVQYEPAFIVDRLSVRLSESTATDTGWEIFSLDYLIDLPLNAVVHTETMSKYRIAFHMLWRLKRVEWSLTITWKQFLSFSHSYDRLSRLSRTATRTTNSSTTPRGAERPPSQQFLSSISLFLSHLKAVFHTANLTRAHMMHVVNNLSAFLMFEVMETTWMSLDQKISEAKSLTEIIVAHDDYLNEILHRSLLSRESELLNIQLQKLLNYILEFCYYEENLVTDAMAYIARQRILYNNLQYQKVMKGDDQDTETVASVGGGKSITSALSVRDMTPMMMNTNDPGISRKCN